MRITDEKGKILGRWNYFDVIIFIAVIWVVLGATYWMGVLNGIKKSQATREEIENREVELTKEYERKSAELEIWKNTIKEGYKEGLMEGLKEKIKR